MAESPPEDDLVLPPVPLVTGGAVQVGGTGRRVSRVELVVSTENGEELRIPLEHHHGAGGRRPSAPPRRRACTPIGCHLRITLTRRGETASPLPPAAPPSRRYEV